MLTTDAILENDGEITLRVSGQLMLGVTRIYGRQVQYLMDDCRDVRERVTRAFRPGVVDLPEEQITADKRSITLAERDIPAFDVFDWSFTIPERPHGSHTAPLSVTNLRTSREYGAFNFGRPIAPSIYGGSRASSREASIESHLDSQEFAPIDLGLDNFDMFNPDETMEVGRDAFERAYSIPRTPNLPRGPDALDMTKDNMDADFSFEPMDLGLDLPPLDRASRASSELSTPPPASPPPVDVTPRTAKRIAVFAERKVKRVRLLAPDADLEVDDDFGSPDEETMEEPRFIPASDEAVRLRSMLANKKTFLPSLRADGKELIFTGPPGLPPALSGLLTFPADVLRRGDSQTPCTPPPHSQNDELEVEVARERQSSRAPSFSLDMGNMDMDMTMDLGEDVNLDFSFRAPSLAPSRAESIAQAVAYDRDEEPLSIFEKSEPTAGFSKATGMAMGVLRREIEAIEKEVDVIDGQRPAVEFGKVARGASKRAASAFFFELLVLGTRDAVVLEQEKAFGPISVSGKEGLWSAYR